VYNIYGIVPSSRNESCERQPVSRALICRDHKGENPMKIREYFLYLIIAIFLLAFIPPLQAQTDDNAVKVIYQTSFTTDPKWDTNNPSTNYWDPKTGMYHFSNEPSTGGYAYTPVNYERGSFTLEYDVVLTRVDEGATFRFGLSGSEMDPSKGPSVLSVFTNAKYGQIMWLHLVTPGGKLIEVNSQNAAVEMGPNAYNGPTVKYEVNKTYHVTISYDDDHKTLGMKVKDWLTGRDIWSYYLNSPENLNGINRIYTGSKGDYGMMSIYADGFIDNVRLTEPVTVTTTQVSRIPSTMTIPAKTTVTKITTAVPTSYPAETTPSSPSSGILAIAAVGAISVYGFLSGRRKQ
jgi:hypothetical protein